GSVTATGGVDGAGIGGGKEGSGGEITISGGSVTAKGGAKSAGIGGGCSGYNELIAISGGTVTAAGGNGGAGIGSAYDLSGEIKISGGCITAVSSANSAVIGGASWIEISGGQVTAVNESDSSAPAIGGDYENVELGLTNPTDFIKDKSGKGYAGTVTIADGKVLGDPEADRAFGEGEVDDISLLTGLTLRPAYTVVFSANDGSDSPAETTLVFPIGSPWALPTNVFSREGYALTGWNTQADGNGVGYSAGEPVTDLSADTLYAVWEEGAPVMSFVEVALRPKDTADETKDLRFVFEITLNSTKLEVGSEWYGSGSAMYELTDISVRYKKGIEGTWSTTPMPIRNLFSVTNTDLTFTVVFVNLTDPGSKCYLAANYAYGLIGETAEFHQGVAVGACIDDIGNGNGIEHPDFPAEP
ncbi:MAG: InlB B-repeat-containing protein, partial [Clostridia bacterium]|nr:InlB B-repeat-containing protein [Clostridia bacterium]